MGFTKVTAGRAPFSAITASGPSMRWAFTCALVLLSSPLGAAARPVPAFAIGAPMRILVVRSAQPGCEGHCATWVALQGTILPGTAAEVRKVLDGLGGRKLPVLISSPGGSVSDAMAIGRLIRARHLDVAVSKTVLDTCVEKDAACGRHEATGSPVALFSQCASACVLILAAGTNRYVGYGTGVGVHQMILRRSVTHEIRSFRVLTRMIGGKRVEVSRTLVGTRPIGTTTTQTDAPAKLYDEVGSYLADMGIARDIMPMMEATSPKNIHWLSPEELRRTRMQTVFKDGEDLIMSLNAEAGASPAGAGTPSTSTGGAPPQAIRPLPSPSTTIRR